MIARRARFLWLLALGLCLSPSGGLAHPMGNFSISHYAGIQVRPEAIELRYLVDLAEIPTFQELQAGGIAADADHPSVAPYLVGKARALGAGLALELNGQRLRLDAGPAQILFTPGAGGLPTMKLAVLYRAAFPAGVSGTNHLSYRDENFADRAGWKEIVAVGVAGATLVESSVPPRDRSRELSDYPVDLSSSPPQVLEARVVFAIEPAVVEARAGLAATPPRASQRSGRLPSSAASAITEEPEPAPRASTARGSTAGAAAAALSLPAAPSSAATLSSPPAPSSAVALSPPAVSSSATALSLPGVPLQPNRSQTPRDAFTALVGTRELSAGVLAFAAMVAVALGALHALEPGHGKTVVAAYLVGSRGTARHALALGLIVTASHTAGVYLLGAVTLYASRYVVPERLYPWLGALSGLVIAALGASLFLRRYAGGDDHAHPHGHVHGRDQAHSQDHAQDHAHPQDHTHPHDHAVPHGHEHQQGHGHAHAHPHPHAHGHHHHVPPDGRVTARQLLALGITGGIVPCPAALVVLLSAVAFGRVGFGLFLIVAFSVGLAAVLIAIGILVVHARRLMARFSGEGRLITRWLPLASSAVVAALGVAIALQALTSAGIVQIRL